MSFNFNGSNYITPVTASAVDASGMDAKTSSFGNVLALVGATKTINPMTVVRFNSFAEAARQLRDPVDTFALKAIEKAFNPSNETGCPDYLLFVNAKTTGILPTQTLLSTTGSTALTLTQAIAGMNLKVSIKDGTPKVGKPTQSLAIINADTGAILASSDKDCSAYYFQLTATTATANLSVSVTADRLTIKANTVSHEFLFSAYGTVGALMVAINAKKISGLNPISIDQTKTGVNNALSSMLDLIDNKTIGQAASPSNTNPDKHAAGVWITGHVRAVALEFSRMTSNGSTLVTVTPGIATNVANIEMLMGANTAPVATYQNWSDAIDLLRVHRVNWLVPLTDDAGATDTNSIFALVNAHCEYMSNTVFMERRALFGLSSGISDTDAGNIAVIMNNERASVVHLGFSDVEKDSVGKLIMYPPYCTAALLAGMICGVTPGTALTNKSINVTGMQKWLVYPEQTDKLISNGVVCCVRNFDGVVKVLQSITTAQTNNYHKREMSVGVAADFTAQAVRNILDPLRGKKKTPYMRAEVISRAKTALDELSKMEPQGLGVLVGDAKNPSYKGLTVSEGADWIRLEFQCSPIIPANYIGITIHTVAYSGAN
jgi:hypothetical protein